MNYEPLGTLPEDRDALALNVAAMTDTQLEEYLYAQGEFSTLNDIIELAEYTGELMDERGLR